MTIGEDQSSQVNRVKTIVRLAGPVFIGIGSQNIMHMVDTVMVGKLGVLALAAVGIASMLLRVFNAVPQGLGPAVQAVTARRLGEGDERSLHLGIGHAIAIMVVFAVPFTLLIEWLIPILMAQLTGEPSMAVLGGDYLAIRASVIGFVGLNICFRGYFNGIKRPDLYMKPLLIVHILNILLNYLLIFGHLGLPALGVNGAAFASVIATLVGTSLYFLLMFRHRTPGFSLHPKNLGRNLIKRLISLAVPSSMQSIALTMGFLIFFTIAAKIDTDSLAVTHVLINLALVCIMLSLGLGIATITLVGHALGAKRRDEARAWVKTTTIMAAVLAGFIGLQYALWPRFFLGLFSLEGHALEIAIVPLILLGLSQVYDSAAIVLMHAHLGGGANRRAMNISVVNQWVLFLPACYILVTYFQGTLLHLWICMVLYRFFLFISFFISIRGNHWLQLRL